MLPVQRPHPSTPAPYADSTLTKKNPNKTPARAPNRRSEQIQRFLFFLFFFTQTNNLNSFEESMNNEEMFMRRPGIPVSEK